MKNSLIAHVKKCPDGTWDEPHLLSDHLDGTAMRAALFAAAFKSDKWGKVLGYAHDTGKAANQWQEYLINKSGYGEDDGHLEGKRGIIDHSTPSAKLADELFGKGIGRLLQYCIAGHHAGLPDWYPDVISPLGALSIRLEKMGTDEIPAEIKKDLLQFSPGIPPRKFEKGTDLSLWIRMLFSCLVDADFLDTELYMNSDRIESRGKYASILELRTRFDTYISNKIAISEKTKVNEIRRYILSDCRCAANDRPGIFTLTVPTGGGKTLSSLAFGLDHCIANDLNRIIYVIPYTSIIEQNADVFREALGDDQVVEHHSNIDDDDSTPKLRLAAENWDAPVIVTTSVQFFESLFAARPGRCRKLHNIVGSVVIIDEAQLMPVEFLAPILETLTLLVKHYRVTLVISTATQPAFKSRAGFNGLPAGLCKEIVRDVPALFSALKRVDVSVPHEVHQPIEWNQLAEELSGHKQVLCVVSDRRSCRELYRDMPPGTYHLSALMCGQHRSEMIDEIKNRLAANESVRVISTQLVEAGVDFDFPVVYRALAGLDSIAQAAGRCNREGKLKRGKVVVFTPPKKAPMGILRKAAETTESILHGYCGDPLDNGLFEKFFSELYWRANDLDENGIRDLLAKDASEGAIQFRTAAKKFRIIDDSNQRTILVPYRMGAEYLDLLKKEGPERWILRKLQRYSVNVYLNDFTALNSKGWIAEVSPGIYALIFFGGYDPRTGLIVDDTPIDPDTFIL